MFCIGWLMQPYEEAHDRSTEMPIRMSRVSTNITTVHLSVHMLTITPK